MLKFNLINKPTFVVNGSILLRPKSYNLIRLHVSCNVKWCLGGLQCESHQLY